MVETYPPEKYSLKFSSVNDQIYMSLFIYVIDVKLVQICCWLHKNLTEQKSDFSFRL